MKVLYDHQFFSILPYSGISRYFYEVISRVALRQDIEASLYMGWHNNKYRFDSLASSLDRYFSRTKPTIPKTTRLFRFASCAGLPIFAASCKPDLYHQTFYWHYLPSFKGRRVLTVYDMIYFVYPAFDQGRAPISSSMIRSIQASHGIIAISECTKRDLLRFLDVPEERVRVIHLANSLTAAASTERPVGMPYMLYVGQRFHWKNFSLLLDVYCSTPALHREVALVCFGGAPLSSDERALLEKHGIPQERFQRFSGPDELLASFYRHAAIFVYPSLYEGFGLPVLEAMHYGCPVLASRRSSVPEVGGDAAVYFDPESKDDLREQLLRCLSDSALRKQLAVLGPQRESRFSWSRCAEQTADFYRDVNGVA